MDSNEHRLLMASHSPCLDQCPQSHLQSLSPKLHEKELDIQRTQLLRNEMSFLPVLPAPLNRGKV